MSIRFIRKVTAVAAASTALLAGAAALAPTQATANPTAGGFFGLIPKASPKLDVAAVHSLIPDFGLNKRDNSGLSFEEQWIETSGVNANGINVVYLQSRAPGPNGLVYCMDARAPFRASPLKFDPVGTQPCNNAGSQRWIKFNKPDGVAYQSKLSRYYLNFKLVAGFPAYDQRSFDPATSVFTKKTPS